MKIAIGHTPDADDAFMFYALLHGKIDTEGILFEDRIEPIAALNAKAQRGVYDMSALSAAAYPSVAAGYDILTAGACMAEKRGPLLIKRINTAGNQIAVPCKTTTAYAALKMYNPQCVCTIVPFDRILDAVCAEEVDGGIIITEQQLTLDPQRFTIVDLGAWWYEKRSLPLPLGIDVIRQSFPQSLKVQINRIFRRSIEYALSHTDEAMRYAVQFGRGINSTAGETFVTTFVNDYTVCLGAQGQEALAVLFDVCQKEKLTSPMPTIRFISEE